MPACMHAYMHARLKGFMHACMHACTRAHAFTHADMHAWTHEHMHTRKHSHRHASSVHARNPAPSFLQTPRTDRTTQRVDVLEEASMNDYLFPTHWRYVNAFCCVSSKLAEIWQKWVYHSSKDCYLAKAMGIPCTVWLAFFVDSLLNVSP